MKHSIPYKIFGVLFPLLFPLSVEAHVIEGNGYWSGVTHPLTGSDHVLAMLAVGIIGVRLGGKKIFAAPAIFVLCMIFGSMLPFVGIHIPQAETGVVLSVLVLGAMITVSDKISTQAAMCCIALFALFHGHVHGEEMPYIAQPVFYALGFVSSTFLLHISGIFIGKNAKKIQTLILKFRSPAAYDRS